MLFEVLSSTVVPRNVDIDKVNPRVQEESIFFDSLNTNSSVRPTHKQSAFLQSVGQAITHFEEAPSYETSLGLKGRMAPPRGIMEEEVSVVLKGKYHRLQDKYRS